MKAFPVSKRWRFGLVAVYLFVLLSPFLSSFTAPIAAPAAHADTNLDKLCVPPYKNLGDNQDPTGNWLSVKIIDRAHMQVIIGGSGKCASPSNLPISQLSPTVPWSQVVGDNFILKDTDTTKDFNYAHCSGGSCSDDTAIVRFNNNAIKNDAQDVSDSYRDDQTTAANITSFLSSAELLLSFEEDSLSGSGVTCSGTNSNLELGNVQNDGNSLKWLCNGGNVRFVNPNVDGATDTVHGLYIRNVVDPSTLVNFDITFNYNGKVIQSVADDLADKRSFSWCTGLQPNQFRNDNCNGNEELFTTSGGLRPLAQADLASVGTGNVPAIIKVDGSNATTTIHIAGSSSASSQLAPADKGNTGSTDCAVSGAISFIFCPLIELTDKLFSVLSTAVVALLNNGTLNTNDQNIHNAQQVWSSFKNFTNIFFVLIFLFVIFSTTLSIGLSNYDIKKMLPRLVIAVILVQFSWILMQLAFDISNILAAGIQALPIFHISTGGGNHIPAASWLFTGIAGLFGAGVLAAASLFIPFLLLLFAGIISILGVFITLFIRQFIIIILVVLSPLAFVAWVLPNTENIFKTWSKSLLRLLFMYPLIVFIFSMAGLFSHIQPACNPASCDINSLAAAIIPIIAFFMVPWTFKWAGGAMAAVSGYVSGKTSGLSRASRAPFNKEVKRIQSQRASNKAADRQIKAGELFGKDTKISRLRAGAMTGNFGQRGQARLAAVAKKAQAEQVQAEKNKLSLALESIGSDDGKKQHLYNAAMTGKTDYEKQAALETMLARGQLGEIDPETGIGGLAAVQAAGGLSGVAGDRFKTENWDDISKKAGYLLESGDTLDEKIKNFGKNTSTEQLATTKAESLKVIGAHAGTMAAGGDEYALHHLSSKIDRLLRNDRQMQNVKGPEHLVLDQIFTDGGGHLSTAPDTTFGKPEGEMLQPPPEPPV